MPERAVFYVQTKRGYNGWVVLQQGQKTPESVHGTKAEAIARARTLARKAAAPSALKIKGRNGRIQREHTYRAAGRS